MARRTLIPIASLIAAITTVWFVATGRTLAAELHVISSDVTARFVPLQIGESLVIELERETTDVLVADPSTVKVLMLSANRASIIGTAQGETNIYFFDAGRRQIEALDVAVVSYPVIREIAPPKNAVVVFRGNELNTLSCTATQCLEAHSHPEAGPAAGGGGPPAK